MSYMLKKSYAFTIFNLLSLFMMKWMTYTIQNPNSSLSYRFSNESTFTGYVNSSDIDYRIVTAIDYRRIFMMFLLSILILLNAMIIGINLPPLSWFIRIDFPRFVESPRKLCRDCRKRKLLALLSSHTKPMRSLESQVADNRLEGSVNRSFKVAIDSDSESAGEKFEPQTFVYDNKHKLHLSKFLEEGFDQMKEEMKLRMREALKDIDSDDVNPKFCMKKAPAYVNILIGDEEVQDSPTKKQDSASKYSRGESFLVNLKVMKRPNGRKILAMKNGKFELDFDNITRPILLSATVGLPDCSALLTPKQKLRVEKMLAYQNSYLTIDEFLKTTNYLRNTVQKPALVYAKKRMGQPPMQHDCNIAVEPESVKTDDVIKTDDLIKTDNVINNDDVIKSMK